MLGLASPQKVLVCEFCVRFFKRGCEAGKKKKKNNNKKIHTQPRIPQTKKKNINMDQLYHCFMSGRGVAMARMFSSAFSVYHHEEHLHFSTGHVEFVGQPKGSTVETRTLAVIANSFSVVVVQTTGVICFLLGGTKSAPSFTRIVAHSATCKETWICLVDENRATFYTLAFGVAPKRATQAELAILMALADSETPDDNIKQTAIPGVVAVATTHEDKVTMLLKDRVHFADISGLFAEKNPNAWSTTLGGTSHAVQGLTAAMRPVVHGWGSTSVSVSVSGKIQPLFEATSFSSGNHSNEKHQERCALLYVRENTNQQDVGDQETKDVDETLHIYDQQVIPTQDTDEMVTVYASFGFAANNCPFIVIFRESGQRHWSYSPHTKLVLGRRMG